MLEVCPSVAANKPRIEVHPLGIGGKEPPARLVFEGHPGNAIVVSLVDMGGRLRMIVQDVKAVKPIYDMPNLPVARIMWKPLPDLLTGAHAWILCGGAHHTVFSYDANAEMMEDFAEMMGIEFVHINEDTTITGLKQQLLLSDLVWKLK
jgi:L-arabinose isomerase